MTIVFQEEIEKDAYAKLLGLFGSEMEIFIRPMTSTQEITLLYFFFF